MVTMKMTDKVKELIKKQELMRGHTPGPWEIRANMITHNVVAVTEKGDVKIATLWHRRHTNGPAVFKSDARLIAAAPKLLEALKKFIEGCEIDSHDGFFDDEMLMAKQAVSKAEGK